MFEQNVFYPDIAVMVKWSSKKEEKKKVSLSRLRRMHTFVCHQRSAFSPIVKNTITITGCLKLPVQTLHPNPKSLRACYSQFASPFDLKSQV